MSPRLATAFAPASVGNVGVGFDVLGLAVGALGDTVRAKRNAEKGVLITAIRGLVDDLPLEPSRNTAGRAVQALHQSLGLPFGIELEIEKGIPLGSGLGGSAASAVAAVVAAAALLEDPLEPARLLEFALEGEQVASGARHPDNVAPSLLGGLVMCLGGRPPRLERVPLPSGIRLVLVHPHLFLATREARAVLAHSIELGLFVRQSALLAGFLAGCYTNDLELVRASLADVVIEPQRARLIPGFAAAHRAALEAGALGGSISGAGPSVFFWSPEAQAERVCAAVAWAFEGQGLRVDRWVLPLESEGARVLACE